MKSGGYLRRLRGWNEGKKVNSLVRLTDIIVFVRQLLMTYVSVIKTTFGVIVSIVYALNGDKVKKDAQENHPVEEG